MILITGGAGYIGSHVNKALHDYGYETVVYDNLKYGHKESVKWGIFEQGDIGDKERMREVFRKYPIEAVFHFAAFAYVGESVEKPALYYKNNVANTLELLECMREAGVSYIIFSSSCSTYGIPEKLPITEEMPQNPVNPYGMTKLITEHILKDYHAAYGLKYCCLRYFNAAGADPEGLLGESHHPETHIIPLILDAAIGKRKSIIVFGTDYDTRDGSCIRDYIHVSDLAKAHLLSLEYLKDGGESCDFNLGNGKGTSVLELIQKVKRITGRQFEVEYRERRQGDPPILIGSSAKIQKVLKWEPEFSDIEVILQHAWKWHEKINRF